MSRFRILAAGAVLASSVIVGSVPATSPPTAAAATPVPSRVLDTRNGIGAAVGQVSPGEVVRLAVPAAAMSAGATSLVVNVTATGASAAGFVTMWSCDEAKPSTSNLNFVPGRSVPNMGIVRPSSSSTVCFEASARVHLIVDLMGWFTGSNDVSPTRPNRIVDTRQTGDPLRGGEFRRIRVGGTTGVPAGARAALVNITVINARSEGFVSAVPCPAGGVGASPGSSTLNFQTGDTVAAFTVTALVDNDVCLYSYSATDVIVDTFGWSSSADGLRLKAPERILDTRHGFGSSGPARSNEVVRLRVAGRGGVPNESAAALLTVTVVNASTDGYVTAWPCDTALPTASVLNYWPGATRANSVLVGLSVATGEVCLSASSVDGSPVTLIADAVGWVPGTYNRPPPSSTVPVMNPLPGNAQFLATFDSADDLDLFDWEVRHGAPNDPSLVPSWQGDHDHNCGSPYTLRTVTQVRNDVPAGPVDNVGDLVWWCGPRANAPASSGHIMTSMVSTGYAHLDFSPRRIFNDVSRVCWDQNYTQVGRKWTQVAIVDEAQFQANGGSLAYVVLGLQGDVAVAGARTQGNAWLMNNGAGGSEVQIGQQLVYQNFDTGGLLGSQDKSRRYRNCAIDQGDGTVRLELERFGGTVIRTAPGSFPDGPVRVMFQDVTYDAPKGPPFQTVLQQNTWHWDNIAVW